MFNHQHAYYFKLICFILFVKAVAIACLIVFGNIGLVPDEAQYWTWSKALDLGYYSKPPGIAWQIWLGTQFFGDTELGVRFMSLLFSFVQSITIFFICSKSGIKPNASFWSALLMAFAPMGFLGSFMAITDVGMLLFWSLACLWVVASLGPLREPNPLIVGVLIMAGALFKWPMYLFWVFYLVCRQLYFSYQKFTLVLYGFFVSLIALLPSIWWNWNHDWATFRHVSSTLQGGSQIKAGSNFIEFIGSQAALLSPIIFVIFLISLASWWKQRKSLTSPIFFCGLVTQSCLAIALLLSLFQKIQGNWAIFAYPTAFVVIGWKINQWKKYNWLWIKGGLAFSLCLIIVILFMPFSPKLNPFKHHLGWHSLERALANVGYDPNNHYLFSDKYQTTSILSFYGPQQKRAYFLNLTGTRRNQFSYWLGIEAEDKKNDGFFVWIENTPYLERDLQYKIGFYQNELEKYFGKVTFLGFETLKEEDLVISKGALFFKCQNCQKLPKETNYY